MAEKMLTLATDAELRASMGAAGRRHAIDNFDLDKQNAKIESLYNEISAAP